MCQYITGVLDSDSHLAGSYNQLPWKHIWVLPIKLVVSLALSSSPPPNPTFLVNKEFGPCSKQEPPDKYALRHHGGEMLTYLAWYAGVFGFDPDPNVCIWGLHVLPMVAWILLRFLRFSRRIWLLKNFTKATALKILFVATTLLKKVPSWRTLLFLLVGTPIEGKPWAVTFAHWKKQL